MKSLMTKCVTVATHSQEMIMQLLSAHQASLELITSLRAQLDSYRVHTNALKGELSAACRRQLASMAASLDYQVSCNDCVTSFDATVFTLGRRVVTGQEVHSLTTQ